MKAGMHYFNFHIGDYKSHTHHLSPIEDVAYRRLLDHYYLHEAPIKQREIARQIGLRDYEQEVLSILEEFFVSTEAGYINHRADKEIEEYHSKKEQASRAGRASAQQRANKRTTDVQQTFNERSTDVQPTSNQEPVTKREASARGTRLSADWQMPIEYREYCAIKRPDLNPEVVAESFKNFWIAKAGRDAVKLDWGAVWKNWVARETATKTSAQQSNRANIFAGAT
jgi:uncharacterized protein YdaU (DUF1376 family)